MRGFRFWVAVLVATMPGWAGANDQSPQDLLIDKLNQVNLNLAANDAAKIPVTLRLADLLAERARVAAMKDLESGCTICEAGKSDREKALRLYGEVLPKASADQKMKILIQTGHLLQLLGNEKAAVAAYESVVRDSAEGALKAEAHLSLAEILYKKNKYSEARSFYQKILDEKSASSRGLSAYRIAWCDFNTGKMDLAVEGIKRILKTPELQSRSTGAAVVQADQGFLEEVSRDLATFMSRRPVSMEELNQVYELSPQTTRLANVVLLANEAERTGKKVDATAVWKYALERMATPTLKIEALVHLTPLQFTEADTSAALKNLENATSLWAELGGCGTNNCAELQKIMRQFIVNWNQTEKKSPSENLQSAYKYFLSIFPEDGQMQLWGAQVAQTRKDWNSAAGFYRGAFAALEKSAKPQEFESYLLSFVEMAEMSKDDALWESATETYLKKSPLKTRSSEVQYQKARKTYDKGDYNRAADLLREIALNGEMSAGLRTQAAHLSLDALVILKNDSQLFAWASEYAEKISREAKAFKEIAQKSILTQSAQLADKAVEMAWQLIAKFDPNAAAATDKKIYLKNKIVLAEKTQRFTQASQAVEEFLGLNGISSEEKEFALGKKTWLAELRLDFTTALQSFEKMQAPQLKADQKFLKMALYADLAGVNSQPFYQKFISTTEDTDLKVAMAAELVRKSGHSEKEIQKHLSILQTKPELLARLYAEAYSKNPVVLKSALNNKTIEPTAWGKGLWRISFVDQLKPQQKKLAAAKLESSSQKALTRTIRARALELINLEKLAAIAIEKGDWTAQVVSLSVVAAENRRFYEELMSLPIPLGLTPEEENQYMSLLGQQAAPYKNRADEAQAKVTEFWTANWKDPLQKSIAEAGESRFLIDQEIAMLQEVAGPTVQPVLQQLLDKREVAAIPAFQEVENSRNAVREAPLDKTRLEKLLQLEKQSKNFAMVQYLEGRIRQLDEKGTSL